MAKKGIENSAYKGVQDVVQSAYEFLASTLDQRQETSRDTAAGLSKKPKRKPRSAEKIPRSSVLYAQVHKSGETKVDAVMPDLKEAVLLIGSADRGKWRERIFEDNDRCAQFIKSAEQFSHLNDKIVIDVAGIQGSAQDERVKKLKDIIDIIRVLKGSTKPAGESLKAIMNQYGEDLFMGKNGALNLLASFERATGYGNFSIKEGEYVVLKLSSKKGGNERITALVKKNSTIEEIKAQALNPSLKAMTNFEQKQMEMILQLKKGMEGIAKNYGYKLVHGLRSSAITSQQDEPILKVLINNEGKYQLREGSKSYITERPDEVMTKAREIASRHAMDASLKESLDWQKNTLEYLKSNEFLMLLPEHIKLAPSESSKVTIIGNARLDTDFIVAVDKQQFYGSFDSVNKKLYIKSVTIEVVDNKEKIKIFSHPINFDKANPAAFVQELSKLPAYEKAFLEPNVDKNNKSYDEIKKFDNTLVEDFAFYEVKKGMQSISGVAVELDGTKVVVRVNGKEIGTIFTFYDKNKKTVAYNVNGTIFKEDELESATAYLIRESKARAEASTRDNYEPPVKMGPREF